MKKFGRYPRGRVATGFTLVELMVVVAIIGILIAFLIPVVKKVRISSQTAATQALFTKLTGAIEQYHQDFGGYPGPLSYQQTGASSSSTVFLANGAQVNYLPVVAAPTNPQFEYPTNISQTTPVFTNLTAGGPQFVSITGTHNLVLGLLGGLTYETSTGTVKYDPAKVGAGPQSLNPGSLGVRRPYIDSGDLYWHKKVVTGVEVKTGDFQFTDDATQTGNDCIIPSFVDRFSEAMPIIYLRGRPGALAAAGYQGSFPYNGAVTAVTAQYDLAQAIGYTSSQRFGYPRVQDASKFAGPNKPAGTDPSKFTHGLISILGANGSSNAVLDKALDGQGTNPTYVYVYPFDFEAYVGAPTNSAYGPAGSNFYQKNARQKDGFILISAGPDRIYGTNDDITNFGDIRP